jgi:hypothetical protein
MAFLGPPASGVPYPGPPTDERFRGRRYPRDTRMTAARAQATTSRLPRQFPLAMVATGPFLDQRTDGRTPCSLAPRHPFRSLMRDMGDVAMRLLPLALLASVALTSHAPAQPPAETQAPAQTPAPAPSTYSKPTSKDCKKEVKELCGRRPKGELQSCLKDGLDLNKFSDSCKAEITKPHS